MEISVSGKVFQAQEARSILEKSRGLMFRHPLRENECMAFFFDSSGYHAFWNLFVSFPIDIVWADEHGIVTHIEGMIPAGSVAIRRPLKPSKYAIEFAGGTAEKLKINVTDKVSGLF